MSHTASAMGDDDRQDVVRARIRREVEVVHAPAEEGVPNRSADEGQLVPGVGERRRRAGRPSRSARGRRGVRGIRRRSAWCPSLTGPLAGSPSGRPLESSTWRPSRDRASTHERTRPHPRRGVRGFAALRRRRRRSGRRCPWRLRRPLRSADAASSGHAVTASPSCGERRCGGLSDHRFGDDGGRGACSPQARTSSPRSPSPTRRTPPTPPGTVDLWARPDPLDVPRRPRPLGSRRTMRPPAARTIGQAPLDALEPGTSTVVRVTVPAAVVPFGGHPTQAVFGIGATVTVRSATTGERAQLRRLEPRRRRHAVGDRRRAADRQPVDPAGSSPRPTSRPTRRRTACSPGTSTVCIGHTDGRDRHRPDDHRVHPRTRERRARRARRGLAGTARRAPQRHLLARVRRRGRRRSDPERDSAPRSLPPRSPTHSTRRTSRRRRPRSGSRRAPRRPRRTQRRYDAHAHTDADTGATGPVLPDARRAARVGLHPHGHRLAGRQDGARSRPRAAWRRPGSRTTIVSGCNTNAAGPAEHPERRAAVHRRKDRLVSADRRSPTPLRAGGLSAERRRLERGHVEGQRAARADQSGERRPRSTCSSALDRSWPSSGTQLERTLNALFSAPPGRRPPPSPPRCAARRPPA